MKQRTQVRLTSSSILPVLCAVILTAALAVPVAASAQGEKEGPERQALEAASSETVEPFVATDDGLEVVVDPETGEIVARLPRQKTDALSAPLANALDHSTDGLHVFDLANGGRGVHLDGRFQHVLMVRVKPDGSLETACVNHVHEAEKFLKRNAAEADMRPREK
jgi:hypothetical protein